MKDEANSLQQRIEAGEIDSVILCAPDVHGRLIGKRIAAKHLASTDKWRIRGNLLSPAMEDKHALFLRPDMGSTRILPWLPATALVPCELCDGDDAPIAFSPRHVLRRQQQRLRKYVPEARFESRLQCYLFEDNYSDARVKKHRNLRNKSTHASTPGIWEGSRQESLLRAIRTHLAAAGVPVVSSTSMFEDAQHEVRLAESMPMESAEHLVLLKHGMKELSALHDRSATFMASWSDVFPSSSCTLASTLSTGDPGVWRPFLAGQLYLAREMCLFFAPFANSYRRLGARGREFCKRAWNHDNHAAGLRIMDNACIEWEWGGADINPYLAYTAIIAAGLHGIDQGLKLPSEGEIFADGHQSRLPRSLQEAIEALNGSTVMREVLGDDVVEFYVSNACIEAEHSREILSWQLQRGFEQA